jgi:hypothetical protein
VAGSDVKRKLAAYVREHADRRELRSENAPEDERSRRSARRLRELAEHIETLPEDDGRLAALERLADQQGADEFLPGADGEYLIGRFAFDAADASQSFDEFVTKLVTVIVRESRTEQMRGLDAQLGSPAVEELLEQFEESDE